jgi:hypothetical protein
VSNFVRKYHKHGKPTVWIHPVTGDYKIPPTDDTVMPLRYRMLGYEVREFHSYHEHQRWMKSKGLVCHATEDVRDDGDLLGKNKWGY